MLELAVIIPTLNERANIQPLLARLETVLQGIEWEALFVDDDSSDGTAALVREISLRDPRVRVVQRIGRRGLASAAIEGMLACSAPYLAVIDGDLQHDERLLPVMLHKLKTGDLDLVIASRNIDGGSMGEFSRSRVALSQLGRKLSRMVSHHDLQDPMSGFVALRRTYFEEVNHRLSGIGFKILLDLIASSRRPVRFEEIPYTFRNRLNGESKLDTAVNLEFLLLLADKTAGHLVPIRFALFVMVGFVGLLVYLIALGVLHFQTNLSFLAAHALSTFAAIVCNFLLNNVITYRDRRLRGWSVVWGFISFALACGLGATINFGFAQLLLAARTPWYIAGFVGMAISSVWNFGITAIVTWRRVRAGNLRADASGSAAAVTVVPGEVS